MKFAFFLVISMMTISSLAFPFKNELSNTQTLLDFNNFITTFGKSYQTTEEFNVRQEVFKANLKKIDKLN